MTPENMLHFRHQRNDSQTNKNFQNRGQESTTLKTLFGTWLNKNSQKATGAILAQPKNGLAKWTRKKRLALARMTII